MKQISIENQKLFQELNALQQGTKEYDQLVSKIVEKNIKLVWSIVHKYKLNHNSLIDDLFSEGSIGLFKAVKSYNIDSGYVFYAYASTCITNEINMFLRKESRRGDIVSLDSGVSLDKNGNELKLENTLASDIDVEEEVIFKNDNLFQIEALQKNLPLLPPIQAEILRLRYLSSDKKIKHYDVGQILGLSQSYVARLEQKAIKNLKIIIAGGVIKTKGNKTLQKTDLRKILKTIIKTKLSKRQSQTLLKLYYSKNLMSQAEIAKMYKTQNSYVAVAKRQGIAKLKKIYNSENQHCPIDENQIIKILEVKRVEIKLRQKQERLETLKREQEMKREQRRGKPREYRKKILSKSQKLFAEKTIEKFGIDSLKFKGELRNVISAKLAPKQSQVIQMLYFSSEKRTFKTIGEIVKRSTNAVINAEFKGIMNLQKILSEEFGQDLSAKEIRMVLRYQQESEN